MAQRHAPRYREGVPTDSIRLSDPFILADSATHTYYMTGTGGLMWTSKNLQTWDGPRNVIEVDTASWMGHHPQVWAAELHQYKGKYYYFATFTNNAIAIDTVAGRSIPRRACHVLVSDRPDGPYRPMQDPVYLPAFKPTLDATLWIDTDGRPYMVYCHEWLQNGDGTVAVMPGKDSNVEATMELKIDKAEFDRLAESDFSKYDAEGVRTKYGDPNVQNRYSDRTLLGEGFMLDDAKVFCTSTYKMTVN